jgi:hypothetical protein
MRRLLLTIFLAGSGVALLAQPAAPDTSWAPYLQIRAVASTPEGSTPNMAFVWKLAKDRVPLELAFSAPETLCDPMRFGLAAGSLAGGPPRTLWTARGEYLGEQAGRQQMRVTTRFLRLGGRDTSTESTQLLSLREGDTVTLDAISEPIDSGCNVHVMTLEARLVLQPADPALAQARYTADMWLVHDGPLSAQMREHLILTVDGTTNFSFVFKQLTFTLPQLDPRQGSVAGAISVAGSLRARSRSDGLVDVDIETNRSLYGLSTRDGARSPVALTLRKTLTLKPDETTAIDFPPPAKGSTSTVLSGRAGDRGQAGASGTPSEATQSSARGTAVEVKEDRLVLNTGEFFKGHKTQLLITLKRLP